MRRTRIYLLGTALAAAALGVFHAAAPPGVQADEANHLWTRNDIGEICSGSCGTGQKCCRIVIVAPAP
jgi:hypothetical protein